MTKPTEDTHDTEPCRPGDKPLSFEDGFADGARRIAGILVPENGAADLTIEYLAGVIKAMEPAMDRVKYEYHRRVLELSDEEGARHFAALERWM